MSNQHQHITLSEAIDLTTRFRATRPSDFFICETFEGDAVRQLLDEPGCAFLRIYLGRKSDGSVVAVLVEADNEERDILPSGNGNAESAGPNEGTMLEDGFRCPQFCPPPSPLNG